MRKFIISDIHGFGNVYYAIMGYLDNLSKEEEIELYINGDLIDRGYESADILLDVKKRIEDNKYKIVYLGGNHELMMHDVLEKRKKDIPISIYDAWYNNGGMATENDLTEKLNNDKNKLFQIGDFISNLKIYQKFSEKIGNKPVILVHAAVPLSATNDRDLRIKDNDDEVHYAVWTREHEITELLGTIYVSPDIQRIGHQDYFTIIGHNPVDNKYGVEYHEKGNYFDIAGGDSSYVSGNFKCDYFPLIELCDGYLKILTFNSNNQIKYGNYFNGKKFIRYKKRELEEARLYLKGDIKIKKLSINQDGICGYW